MRTSFSWESIPILVCNCQIIRHTLIRLESSHAMDIISFLILNKHTSNADIVTILFYEIKINRFILLKARTSSWKIIWTDLSCFL